MIQNLPSLITILDSYSGIHSTLLSDTFTSKLRAHAESLEKLSELVETTVDLQPLDSSSSNHNFQIKPEFDEKLDQCRAQMEDLWKKMEREAVKVSRDLGMELDKKLKFEKNNIYGYHFRLTRTDAAVLRTKQLIYPELSTQKAGVLFTCVKWASN